MRIYAKHCSACKKLQFAEDFYSDNRATDGLRSQCKMCQNKINASWQQRNKDKQAKYSAKYTANNLQKHAEKESRRRATLRQAKTYKITASELKKMLQGNCFYCGQTKKLTIEHIVPLVRGGNHSIGNLVGACQGCNSKKRHRFIMEWRKSLD